MGETMADKFGLDNSWKKLQQKWQQAKSVWHDPVCVEFEQTFLVPLVEQEERTQRELERLTQAIEQASRNVR